MKNRKRLAFLFCLLLCYSLFQLTARAQDLSTVSVFSQGSIASSSSPSGVNLAVIPNDWPTYDSDPSSWTACVHVDYGVTYSGQASIRIDPHTSADSDTTRECDGPWISCKPGDHIVLEVWVKTTASGGQGSTSYPGGRVGIDFYGDTSDGFGILYSNYADHTTNMGFPGYWGGNSGSIGAGWYSGWGQNWVMIGWDVTVPSTLCNGVCIHGNVLQCNPTHISSFVPILDVRPAQNTGVAWFAGCELYLNPS